MRFRLVHALAALWFGCAVPACSPSGASASRPPDTSRDEGPRVERVLRWALGPRSRARRPRTGDAYLLLLGSGQPVERAAPVADECVEAESFLPAPEGDPRFFFVSRGRLFARSVEEGRLGPAEVIETGDLSLQVEQLLGFVSASSPLRLLVSGRARGAAEGDLWLLTLVEAGRAGVERVSEQAALKDEAMFFATFVVPRCLAAGRRCLVLDEVPGDGMYLEVESERGKAPAPLKALGTVEARDAAWASRDGSRLYLLVGCPEER
jgi:hypothetical protein